MLANLEIRTTFIGLNFSAKGTLIYAFSVVPHSEEQRKKVTNEQMKSGFKQNVITESFGQMASTLPRTS